MTSVLASHLTEELVALRRRAYGPDADIDTDPAALARLAELERRAVGTGVRAAGGRRRA